MSAVLNPTPPSPFAELWRDFRRNRGAMIGLAVIVALLLCALLGLLAGFFRGGVEFTIMRLMDIMLALPSLLLAVAVVAILDAAALGFLGLGAQPPTPEWGSMLASALEFIQSAWWVVTLPGLAILITVLAFNLTGDGLRDALDPKLKR